MVEGTIRYYTTRGSREFKDVSKKNKIWAQKSTEFGVDVAILKTWVDSMRTRLGKLTRPKSGDAPIEHTERDYWIIDKFDFLTKHIPRMPRRQLGGLKTKTASSTLQPTEQPESEHEEEDDDFMVYAEAVPSTSTDPFAPAQPLPTTSSTTTVTPTPTTSKKATKKTSRTPPEVVQQELATLRRMVEQHQTTADIQTTIKDMMQQMQDDNTMIGSWCRWLSTMVSTQVDPSLHNIFVQRSFEMVMDLAKQTSILKNRQHHQQQHKQQYQQLRQQHFHVPATSIYSFTATSVCIYSVNI